MSSTSECNCDQSLALLDELKKYREDLLAAAGELAIPAPEPGTDMARLLMANILLRRDCGYLTRKNKELQTEVDLWRAASEVKK